MPMEEQAETAPIPKCLRFSLILFRSKKRPSSKAKASDKKSDEKVKKPAKKAKISDAVKEDSQKIVLKYLIHNSVEINRNETDLGWRI